MKNIIIAWCNKDENAFENHVPLLFTGRRNLSLGFSNNIDVLFLDGFNRLSDEYKSDLINLGYVLHDVGPIYKRLSDVYTVLNRFGDYEKKCFLRWFVINEYFPGESIIHYDGDIVFNEDPEVIAKKVDGLTFVLQGCPAFTVIHNQDWFKLYKEELKKFTSNIESYSCEAWALRDGWGVTFKTRWSGSRFRETITSDQDFISHLIHTGGIIQDSVEKVTLALKDYFVFENPLFIHMYDDNFPYNYSRENGIDYFYGVRIDGQNCPFKKRILFWHMQSCFVSYLSKFLLRSKLFKFIPLGRVRLDLCGRGYEDRINRFCNKFLKYNSRLNVYNYFFYRKDFSSVFQNKYWWKKGIFE